MQKTSRLSIADRALLEMAKKHIMLHYRDKVTSMAAALRTKNGKIFTSINVKYKPVWKCICAERVAIAKAIEAGEIEFDTIVTVKYEPETKEYFVVNMCGECRQVAIFYKGLKVLSVKKGPIESVSIEEVFPYPYS